MPYMDMRKYSSLFRKSLDFTIAAGRKLAQGESQGEEVTYSTPQYRHSHTPMSSLSPFGSDGPMMMRAEHKENNNAVEDTV